MAVLAAKLLVHVGIPVAILLALKAPLRPLFDTGLDRRGFWPTLIVMGAVLIGLLAVVSPSLASPRSTTPSLVALSWASPNQASPSRGNPGCTSPSRLNPGCTSPSRVNPSRVGPNRVAPSPVAFGPLSRAGPKPGTAQSRRTGLSKEVGPRAQASQAPTVGPRAAPPRCSPPPAWP